MEEQNKIQEPIESSNQPETNETLVSESANEQTVNTESPINEAEPIKPRITDEEREKNLAEKLNIIEELKQLTSKEEMGGKTFQEFRSLQERWRAIGPVPQNRVSDLWETYHVHVENFYNYIKINKELRDLDLRHNFEEKTKLCEKAEALLKEENIADAFKSLQDLHAQWKEIGPVAKEAKDVLWDNFKATTSSINEKYHIFFEELRKRQEAALIAKDEICKKAEEIANTAYTSLKEWQAATEKIISLQGEWKSLGEVSIKDRNRIFRKFRASCDKFFNAKRDFFKIIIDEQTHNLELKRVLCEKVEALQNSEEWKETTDAIIAAQKEWKEIGAVAQKHSLKIWTRFRAACDTFFNRKNEHFKGVDSEQTNNLNAKHAIIDEIKTFVLSDNPSEDLAKLKEFQDRWNKIGFVPIKKKEALQEQYKKAMNKVFENLDIPEKDKELEKFRSKVNTFEGNRDKNAYKIVSERDKLVSQIRQLENEIKTLENNMGFFSSSKKADGLIAELQNNLNKSKEKLGLLKEKLNELDKII